MSDIKIEIVGEVVQRNGTYNGTPYTAYSQPAYLHRPSEIYPEKVSFSIESANDALPVGFYEIDFDKSLQVGQWNALGFNRNLKLIPSKPSTQVGSRPLQSQEQKTA